MPKVNHLWIVCLAGALVGGSAFAADAPSTAEVLDNVHHSNQKEVAMGKLAQSHGMAKDVQRFGKTLVKDHSAADKKVAKLAKAEKVALTNAVLPAMDDSKTGAAFDNAFAKGMLEDHNKDIAEVTAARDATTDPKLKKLLSDILPVLHEHQQMAQKLVDASSKSKS